LHPKRIVHHDGRIDRIDLSDANRVAPLNDLYRVSGLPIDEPTGRLVIEDFESKAVDTLHQTSIRARQRPLEIPEVRRRVSGYVLDGSDDAPNRQADDC
jgi:hypothetical protein